MVMAALMESWVIAAISAVVGISVTLISTVYWFGRNTVTLPDLHELRDLAIAHRDELKGEIASERRDVGEGLNTLRREVGEGLSALRQYIVTVELDLSKNYVRRESWHQAMGQLQETFGKSDAAAEQRMLRLEEKIDRLTDRVATR